TKYFRRGIGKEYAFLALKKKVGIPSLTADYIIDCFKNGKKPYWNGVYSNKERWMLVEMLANELGKSPNELKPYDFRRGVKVFYGKSLVGLAVHYRSPEGRFGEEEVAQMLEKISSKKEETVIAGVTVDEKLLKDINIEIDNIRSLFGHRAKRLEEWILVAPKIDKAIKNGSGARLIHPLYSLLFGTTKDERNIRFAILDCLRDIDHPDTVKYLTDFVAQIGSGDYEVWQRASDILAEFFEERSETRISSTPSTRELDISAEKDEARRK
ncbi:unnamed protein product, partial [marine sediment metagenome]